jgi:spore germination protein YaaH
MPENASPSRRARGVVLIGALALALAGALGFALTRDTWSRSGPPIRVSSWAPYWQPDAALASFTANSEMFSDLAVVAYSARGTDEVVMYESLPDTMIPTYRSAAQAVGVPLIATVFDDSDAGEMAGILADPATRTRHVQALVTVVNSGGTDGLGFDGLDLDYEKFAFSDGRDTWAATSPNWISFLAELSAALRAQGKQLIVSVPPIYDDGSPSDSGYWVYDYASMAPLVDRIRVMAYDYSIASGDPGPIAPIQWVRDLVDAITDVVPAAKIDLGIPTYGYDWVLGIEGTCPADQQPDDKAMSTQRAARTVAERGITPSWDIETEERRFDYVDTLTGLDETGATVTCTVTRTVRYLDAVAVQRRAFVAHRSDLHGVALWALGNDDPLTWDGLRAARLGEETWGDITSPTTVAPSAATTPTTTPS